MVLTAEWMKEKLNDMQKMQQDLDKKIQELQQQKLVNYGAINMLAELVKVAESPEVNQEKKEDFK